MKKLILLLSFVCLGLLTVGTAMKLDNVLFWLASDSTAYQYIRLLLALVVLILFSTNPPRRAWLRVSTGLVAAAVGAWTINLTFAYAMNISDTICFLATSIAIAVAVLERETATYKNPLLQRNSLPNFNNFRVNNYRPTHSFK